jgi:autotransporter-associated beta strand protein
MKVKNQWYNKQIAVTHLDIIRMFFFLVLSVGCCLSVLMADEAHAASATWDLNPADNNWDNAANWTPNTVPNEPGDVATFAVSNITDVSIMSSFTVGGLIFTADASAYTIANTSSMEMAGNGVTNNSAVTQSFTVLTPLSLSGSATIGSDVVMTTYGEGKVEFGDRATAGAAQLVNEGAVDASNQNGVTEFLSRSSAGNSTIVNNPPQNGAHNGGEVIFFNSSTAGRSTITAMSGAFTIFEDQSNGGNATLIAMDGGTIDFESGSDGRKARVQLYAPGNLDISRHGSAPVAIGALTGDGVVYLGQRTLVVGSDSGDSAFTGVIRDTGGLHSSHGGSLTKTGTGSLTLSGANLYERLTTVQQGSLFIDNQAGSGTGTGAVNVEGGTLGGAGIIAGSAVIGTGAGGAFLAPAKGGEPATLTIQSTVTFNSDATYACTLQASKKKSANDEVVANGVTINSGAQFNLVARVEGKLKAGTSFTVISNTASTPIGGTFANLADGAILTVGNTNLQASYEGGDGNDLTLTVVPNE